MDREMVEELKIQTNELDRAVGRPRRLASANGELAIQSGIFTHGCLNREEIGLNQSLPETING
jgi:hypothetical protein